MPLIPQQSIVSVPINISRTAETTKALEVALEPYPPVKIVSITADRFRLYAVIETV